MGFKEDMVKAVRKTKFRVSKKFKGIPNLPFFPEEAGKVTEINASIAKLNVLFQQATVTLDELASLLRDIGLLHYDWSVPSMGVSMPLRGCENAGEEFQLMVAKQILYVTHLVFSHLRVTGLGIYGRLILDNVSRFKVYCEYQINSLTTMVTPLPQFEQLQEFFLGHVWSHLSNAMKKGETGKIDGLISEISSQMSALTQVRLFVPERNVCADGDIAGSNYVRYVHVSKMSDGVGLQEAVLLCPLVIGPKIVNLLQLNEQLAAPALGQAQVARLALIRDQVVAISAVERGRQGSRFA
jgi:hypothetical protein